MDDMSMQRRNFLHGVLALPGVASLAHGIRPSFGTSVRTGEELKAALAAATPGTTIVLAPGDFGDVAQFDLSVPDVTIRASVPQRSIIRSPLEISGDRAQIVDLAFRGEGEDNLYMVAVAACSDLIAVTASGVEIRGCDFGYFPGRAIFARQSATGIYIHDCGFHNNVNGKGSDSNAHEAISLGYSNLYSRTSMKARVINNKFWNLNVEGEAISVKTSDNLVQGNQLSSSRGGFTQRYGRNNTFSGNTSTNSRGIAIGGQGAKIINNRINGTGRIAIQAGNASATQPHEWRTSAVGRHHRRRQCRPTGHRQPIQAHACAEDDGPRAQRQHQFGAAQRHKDVAGQVAISIHLKEPGGPRGQGGWRTMLGPGWRLLVHLPAVRVGRRPARGSRAALHARLRAGLGGWP